MLFGTLGYLIGVRKPPEKITVQCEAVGYKLPDCSKKYEGFLVLDEAENPKICVYDIDENGSYTEIYKWIDMKSKEE